MKLAPESDWMLGEAFSRRAKHHDGIKELWETKWKFPVSLYHSASRAIKLTSNSVLHWCLPLPRRQARGLRASIRISYQGMGLGSSPICINDTAHSSRTISTTRTEMNTPKPSSLSAMLFSRKPRQQQLLSTTLKLLRSTSVSLHYTVFPGFPS